MSLRLLRPEGCGKTCQFDGENIATKEGFGISLDLTIVCALYVGRNAQNMAGYGCIYGEIDLIALTAFAFRRRRAAAAEILVQSTSEERLDRLSM